MKRADVMSQLQAKLLGDIERALAGHEITKTALERADGPSQQVLDKWAHGASPTLRTLERLVAAFNKLSGEPSTELIVAIPGVSDPHASFAEHFGEAMSKQSAHDKELAERIATMSVAERLILLGQLRERAAHHPSGPDVE